MAALVCDLCGGKLVMVAGGIAVCDSCGMEHSANLLKEKIQEIKGTVRIDNSHKIQNYLEMANNAYESVNNVEAELYCNKIIEIDPTNHMAWFLNGKAAGWQSTLQNSRLLESVSAFSKAITNSPEEEKEELISQSTEQVINLTTAMIVLRGQNFAKWPEKEEALGFLSDITLIMNVIGQFLIQAGVSISLSELMTPIVTIINQSVVNAYKDVISPDYNGDLNDSDDRADKYELQRYIERIENCTLLLNSAIHLCDENNEFNVQLYKNLITLHENAIDSCSWDYNLTNRGTKIWRKRWSLTEKEKNARRLLIQGYEMKIKAIKDSKKQKEEEAAQKRLINYWIEHADEKIALEAERTSLEDQVSALRVAIINIPGKEEKENIQRHINTLTIEENSLGLFKRNKKKAIQDKIATANLELKKVIDRIEAYKKEIEKEIDPLQKRIDEINFELRKAR